MPKLWNETIAAHRQEVHDAILETTWALAAERGLHALKMSEIAQATGIGRATLYKYFPNVEAILTAWHHRHVVGHLERLTELRNQPGSAGARLTAVLETYALICHHRARHGPELGALLHRGEHVAKAQQQLHDLMRDLLAEAVTSGAVRDDISPSELATYCLHALGAAATLRSEAAARRLAMVTLDGLHPPR